MNTETQKNEAEPKNIGNEKLPQLEMPFVRAPERVRTIFLVILFVACGPLAAGIVIFGWRALVVAIISVISCTTIEKLYYRITRTPALLGRSHAWLTGVLLALTLPAYVPWYIPLIASAFAIIVGKAIFGGVGHFLWQPALLGRLVVTVIFPATLTTPFANFNNAAPVLAQNKIILGDIKAAKHVEDYRQWHRIHPGSVADAFIVTRPKAILAGLTSSEEPVYSGLNMPADIPRAKSAVLKKLPPINDLIYGVRPGSIGETCAIMIIVAGLYLVYRNYVKWQLPMAFVVSTWIMLAIVPIKLAGPNNTIEVTWFPLWSQGLAAGFTYVNYQLLSSELLLAAFFMAPEMTSRPVTTGGQVLFGIGCGVAGTLFQLYLALPIAFYMAVLVMNTFTPAIESMWHPRVLGKRRFEWVFKHT